MSFSAAVPACCLSPPALPSPCHASPPLPHPSLSPRRWAPMGDPGCCCLRSAPASLEQLCWVAAAKAVPGPSAFSGCVPAVACCMPRLRFPSSAAVGKRRWPGRGEGSHPAPFRSPRHARPLLSAGGSRRPGWPCPSFPSSRRPAGQHDFSSLFLLLLLPPASSAQRCGGAACGGAACGAAGGLAARFLSLTTTFCSHQGPGARPVSSNLPSLSLAALMLKWPGFEVPLPVGSKLTVLGGPSPGCAGAGQWGTAMGVCGDTAAAPLRPRTWPSVSPPSLTACPRPGGGSSWSNRTAAAPGSPWDAAPAPAACPAPRNQPLRL